MGLDKISCSRKYNIVTTGILFPAFPRDGGMGWDELYVVLGEMGYYICMYIKYSTRQESEFVFFPRF